MGKNMKRVLLIGLVAVVAIWLVAYFYLMNRGVNLVANNGDPQWNAGEVFHMLPTVSHNRMLLKVSFNRSFNRAPRLVINNDRAVSGAMTDTKGYFWQFDIDELSPGTTYQLKLQQEDGSNLCDPWPLATFPAPEDKPEKLRLLIYTGLGGHDINIEWFGTGPLPLETRIRLLKKALSFKPDAVISSGDQIYYDLLYDASSKVQGSAPRAMKFSGEFNRNQPVLGTENEEVLKKATGPQIANLYGTALRSTPTFFLLDDHDYFENDIAKKEEYGRNLKLLFLAWRSPFFKGGVSFPPDEFMLDLGRTAQKLYLPEFLPDQNRPTDIPGTGSPDRAPGVSETYGTLRYGKLFEGLLYESRRFITLTGKDATFVHPLAEDWLVARMKAEETTHVVNLPATIFGWSAGKWMEWYPDILGDDGRLTTAKPKYKWQEGWFLQHNRLLEAASNMKKAAPLFICGDIHSLAEGRIMRSGELDLSRNPVISVASGSLGTGKRSFPSAFRGTLAKPPVDLEMEERLSCVEKNGFVIVDFTHEQISIRFYAWRPPEPVENIETMKAFHQLIIPVKTLSNE